MEKLFVITMYNCVRGICTEDYKSNIIKEIADNEFSGDIGEATDYVEFKEFTINKIN